MQGVYMSRAWMSIWGKRSTENSRRGIMSNHACRVHAEALSESFVINLGLDSSGGECFCLNSMICGIILYNASRELALHPHSELFSSPLMLYP